MFQSLVPFITPLLLALSFWQIFSHPRSIFIIVPLAILLIWWTGKLLSRRYFLKFSRLWLNLSLVYVSQVLFVILLSSDIKRYWLTVVWVIIWGFILWLLRGYFRKLKEVNDLDYLAFNRFLYYLAFWLLTTSIFYLVVFINFSVIYSLIILLLATYLWAGEIIMFAGDNIDKRSIWLIILTTTQILWALYLLPLGFYIAGTIATLWIFFILELILSRSKHFIRYLGLFLVVVLLVFITAYI